MTPLEDILRPPTDQEVSEALRRFAERVRHAYGARLKGLYLFGSRARRDHHDESDADVAVVIEDGDWRFWDEKMRLVDLGHDMLVDFRLYIQPWPFSASAWTSPEGAPRQRLIEAAKRDARPLETAAREVATAIQKAAELRRDADYNPEGEVSETDVRLTLERVSAFIEACAKLVESSSGPDGGSP